MRLSRPRATLDGSLLEFVESFIPRYLAAWRTYRAEAVLALMTDDVLYEDDGWPQPMHGHEAVREYLDYLWRAYPDLEFDFVGGPYFSLREARVAHEWRCWGTMTGRLDPPGIEPTGRRFEYTGIEVHTYRDSRICHLRAVGNVLDVVRQLGLLQLEARKVVEA